MRLNPVVVKGRRNSSPLFAAKSTHPALVSVSVLLLPGQGALEPSGIGNATCYPLSEAVSSLEMKLPKAATTIQVLSA